MRKSLMAIGFTLMCSVSTAHAEDIFVDQADSRFSQALLTLKVGDTVHFRNKDTATHDIRITEPSGSVDDKGLQKPGEDIVYTFDKPGEYQVGCAIHTNMKLAVTVK